MADQRSAVEKLPDEWSEMERERFQRKLQEYSQQYSAAAPANTPALKH